MKPDARAQNTISLLLPDSRAWCVALFALHGLCACSGGDPASGAGGGSGNGDGGSGASSGQGGGDVVFGQPHTGDYNLGPVDWQESQWTNACSPYPAKVTGLEGGFLAGVSTEFFGKGQLCDACILVQTNAGKSLIVRVITSGQTNRPGDIDLSQTAYDALQSGEYPRSMKWQITKCPPSGKVQYQFQTGAHQDWSSLWLRNPRLPLDKLEVQSKRHATWAPLTRGTDGTYTDSGGFGAGSFTLRATAVDGQTLSDTFPSFKGGDLLESGGQFQ